MVTNRAKNRQAYNKSKMPPLTLTKPSVTSPGSLPPNGQNILASSTHMIDSLPNWRALSLGELAALEPTQLHQLQQNLSPEESQELYKRAMEALQATPLPPASQPSSLNFSQKADTGLNASSGVGAEPPESLSELQIPLTGKDARRFKDLLQLEGLFAGVCLTIHKATGNEAFYKDADAIGLLGMDVAESWARLARKHAWLATVLDRFIGATEIGLLLASTGQLLQAIANNHGLKTSAFRFRPRGSAEPVAA